MTARAARPERIISVDIEKEFHRIQRYPDGRHLYMHRNNVMRGYNEALKWSLRTLMKGWPPGYSEQVEQCLQRHQTSAGDPGSPDYTGAWRRRWAGIEVKTDVGELSDIQRAWHAAMKGKGGFVAVVRGAGDIVPALAACDAGAVEWP